MWQRSRFLLLLEHGLLRLSLPAGPLASPYGALHAEPRRPAAEVIITEILSTPQQQKRFSILMDIILLSSLLLLYISLYEKNQAIDALLCFALVALPLTQTRTAYSMLHTTLYNLMRSHLHFNKYILILFKTISFLCSFWRAPPCLDSKLYSERAWPMLHGNIFIKVIRIILACRVLDYCKETNSPMFTQFQRLRRVLL